MKSLTQHRSTALFWFILFVSFAVVAYWPAFFSERIWDDHFLVGRNPFFRSPVLALECFRHWLYPFEITSYFRPVQNLSYMVDYWLWSENLSGYHLTNILLHSIAALLLAIAIRRIANVLSPGRADRNRLLAFAAGIIWLVHPIHHAAVAYVAGRADSLAAVFALSAWLLADRGFSETRRTVAVGLFTGAAFLAALALFSKEIAVTWMLLFCVYEAFFRTGGQGRRRIGAVGGTAFVVLLYFLYRQTLPHLGGVVSSVPAPEIGGRALQALRALGDYLSIVLLPVNLHMERQLHEPSEALRLSTPWLYYHAAALVPLGLAGLASAILISCGRGEDTRLRVFGLCWFFIGFLPISNIFPLNAPVAEHWIYMPSAGMILILGSVILSVRLEYPAIGAAGFCAITALLIFLTHQQSRTWVTEERMFRTAIDRGGDTLRARTNLARALMAKGDLDGAEVMVRGALTRNPQHPILRAQLSAILQKAGREVEGSTLAEGAHTTVKGGSVRIPNPWVGEAQRIKTMIADGRSSEAESQLRQARERWPWMWELVHAEVLLHSQADQPGRAVETLAKYVLTNWWHREAVVLLAQYLAQARRYDEAVQKYHLAGRLDIHNAGPWEQITVIRLHQGRADEALISQKRAIRSEPHSAEQRLKLSQVYMAMGDEVEAMIERQAALELQAKSR